jgi:hypothetical protein
MNLLGWLKTLAGYVFCEGCHQWEKRDLSVELTPNFWVCGQCYPVWLAEAKAENAKDAALIGDTYPVDDVFIDEDVYSDDMYSNWHTKTFDSCDEATAFVASVESVQNGVANTPRELPDGHWEVGYTYD